MIGLNDGVFPKIMRPVSFDLMTGKKRLGDRSIKEEDKYLFLEALLSAEMILSISYIGQSIQDNTTLPPSSLLNELLYYIDRGYRLAEGNLTDRLVTRHPLKAFSSKYFDGSDKRLFSYSKENFQTAKNRKRTVPLKPFLSECLDFKPDMVNVETLTRFFTNPCQYLLNEGLGVFLEEKKVAQKEHELFSLDALSSFLIQAELLQARYQTETTSDMKEIYRNKNRLPLQWIGDLQYRALKTETQTLFDLIDPHVFGRDREPIEYDFDFEGLRLNGTFDNIWHGKLVHFSPARCKAKLRLALWIDQLVYCCATGQTIPGILISKAVDYGKNRKHYTQFSCLKIESPEMHLKTLVAYFLQGHQKPLAFFPDSTLQYVTTRKVKSEEEAITKTLQTWEGRGNYKKGEKENVYINLCFQHTTLLKTEFRKIGTDIWGPLIEAQQPQK